jgi:nucleotide-binding universal stress UspA family protein
MANTIVCGVDGSKESVAAAELGVRWARALGATAVLVHAVDAASFPRVESATGEIRAKRILDAAHRALGEIQVRTSRPIDRQVVAGPPAVALAAVAEERGALAVCVGSRGRGPLRAALLGSTSRAAVRECACPVLVVPRPAAARAGRGESIVCGLDGSDESANALRAAAKLRRLLDLKLVLVHVKSPGALVALAPAAGPPPLGHSEQLEASDRAGAAVTDRVAEQAGIVADAVERVEAGEASSVIDATAEEEDAALIVVGTHARGALEGAASGSVSSRLAASASRPVLLVRADVRLGLG